MQEDVTSPEFEQILRNDLDKPDEDDLDRVEKGFWPKVARIARKGAGKVPFLNDAVAMYFCAFDPATPLRVKAVLVAALAYFVLPADMIPDVLALVGFSDDAAVLMGALNLVGNHVSSEHKAKAREALLINASESGEDS